MFNETEILRFLSIPIFVIFTFLFTRRALGAILFNKKTASAHNFTEGALCGSSYPLYILSYGLIFIGCAIFLASDAIDEPVYLSRILILALLCFLFLFFRSRIPPLMAIWFGRTAFWYKKGIKGKINYTDIFGAKLLKDPKSRNPHALCKIVFFAQCKNTNDTLKKFHCKLPLSDLETLAREIQISAPKGTPSDYRLSKRLKFVRSTLAVFSCLLFLNTIVFAFSTGIVSPSAYAADSDQNYITKTEIKTMTAITNVIYGEGKIFVHYSKIEIINIYSEDGEYLWSVSLSKTLANNSKIEITTDENGEKTLCYTIYDTLYKFTLDGDFISETTLDAPIDSTSITDKYVLIREDKLIRFNDRKIEQRNENGEFITLITNSNYYIQLSSMLIWLFLSAQILVICILKHLNKTWGALIYNTNIYSEVTP